MTRVDVSRKACLLLTGRPIGKRFEVVLNGRSLALTGTSFYYLFRLAHQAMTTVDGWITRNDIEPGNNHARYIYRMKGELAAQGEDGSVAIENDYHGSYRLDTSALEVESDLEVLTQFPDVRVVDRVRQMSARLQFRNKGAAAVAHAVG